MRAVSIFSLNSWHEKNPVFTNLTTRQESSFSFHFDGDFTESGFCPATLQTPKPNNVEWENDSRKSSAWLTLNKYSPAYLCLLFFAFHEWHSLATRSPCHLSVMFEIYILLASVAPVFTLDALLLHFSLQLCSPTHTHTRPLLSLLFLLRFSWICNIISGKSVASRLLPEGFPQWAQL